MEQIIIGYLAGVTSVIAIWIFFNARGKGLSPSSIKNRIDSNNITTERGLGSLKTNNKESGRIIDEAEDEVKRGLKALGNTDRAISEIIAASRREGRSDD